MDEEHDEEEQEQPFEGEEPISKKTTEAGTATEPGVDQRPKIGAVLCTIFSIAIVITFCILVVSILLMPAGGSQARKEPLINDSYVGPSGNDSDSTSRESISASGTSSTTPEEEEDETTAKEQEGTSRPRQEPPSTPKSDGGKGSETKPEATTGGDDIRRGRHTTKKEPEKLPETTEKKTEPITTAARNPPTVSVSTTTTTTTMTTTKTTTATTTPGTSKEPTTTTTTVKPMPYNSLICTLNANMNQKKVSELPEDGLCDLSFYQADETDHAVLEGPGGPFAATLELIVQAAAQHTKTEYGLSFDYYHMKATEKLLADDVAKRTLDDLWKKKIYHYGFLLLSYFKLDVKGYRQVFHNLQKVKDILQRDSVPTRPSYFLIGETFCTEPWLNHGFNNIRERMHVHGAIVYGHIVEDDRGVGQILPPSFWNWTSIRSPKIYEYNLDTAHTALSKLPYKKLGYTQFFLSVSLGGRYYTPTKGEKHEILAGNGYLTNETLLIDIGKVCTDKDWVGAYREESPMGGYYDNSKIERVVTYDDQKSFRWKLCKGKKQIVKEKYGIAAYDADLDDPGNVCGKGAYSRLRFLKSLLHFLNEKFKAEGDYDACMKLQ